MPAYRVIYESMQAQLAQVGIKMDVKVVDHATMHDQIRKDVNPLVVYVAFRPTADAYLTQFFHSDSIVVTGKNPNTNFAHYDKVDAQIDRRATSRTPPSRRRCGSRPRRRRCRTWSRIRSSTPTRSTRARRTWTTATS